MVRLEGFAVDVRSIHTPCPFYKCTIELGLNATLSKQSKALANMQIMNIGIHGGDSVGSRYDGRFISTRLSGNQNKKYFLDSNRSFPRIL